MYRYVRARVFVCSVVNWTRIIGRGVYTELFLFLADLIKESRLTTLQRNTLRDRLRSSGGGSAPPSAVRKPAVNPVKRHQTAGTRRTLEHIVESGAYEPEAYAPRTRPSKTIMLITKFPPKKRIRPVRLNARTVTVSRWGGCRSKIRRTIKLTYLRFYRDRIASSGTKRLPIIFK